MKTLAINSSFWRGRRVLVTGHTGFKGCWLTMWLKQMGAEITGLSLAPATHPSLFNAARAGDGIVDLRGDIRDVPTVTSAVGMSRPEVVFHLAAQALVRESYLQPAQTYATNVMGTVNVLEAIRASEEIRVAIVVTSDKCYLNDNSGRAYQEPDSLGGSDPYSSSKASAELVAAAWRESYLAARGVAIATARAGNVIGGGDWADDRIVPDMVRAWSSGTAVRLRNPLATRPWQHVLVPLSGYVSLAEAAWTDPTCATAWNFGPTAGEVHSVAAVVEMAAVAWGPDACWEQDADTHPHEAKMLALDSTKAEERLGFKSQWSLEQSIEETISWYRRFLMGDDMREVTLSQIRSYSNNFAQ